MWQYKISVVSESAEATLYMHVFIHTYTRKLVARAARAHTHTHTHTAHERVLFIWVQQVTDTIKTKYLSDSGTPRNMKRIICMNTVHEQDIYQYKYDQCSFNIHYNYAHSML